MRLSPVQPESVNEEQRRLFERSKKENKMVPNMFKVMANHPPLLEAYMNGYAAFRSQSKFTPAEAEVVFLTISAENNCTYCVGGHSFAADLMSKVPLEVTEAIRNNTALPEGKLKELSVFTSLMVNKRGNPYEQDVEAFLKAGYTEQDILSIILAISVKTISNYTNHIFRTELDGIMKTREWLGYKVARKMINFFRS
ncbi:MAG: carboxymuconolactone decarboxylase family protein [Bacteroidetes bacterium]|nr:carboxymuconolactone decarboxylase family protein [Bacteroidota bacterium]